ERAFVTPVTINYFTTLGVVPALGRLFDARDSDQPGASPVAVVSYRFFTQRLNSDPAMVGRSVILNRQPYTIVGVAPEGFHGTGVRSGDAWIPLGMSSALSANRAGAWLLLGGKLKPGIDLPRAAAEIATIGRTLQQEYPEENRDRGFVAQALSPVP